MNKKSVKNLKTGLFGRRERITKKRREVYYDPFFADPETVEDDYRRLKAGHG